MTSKTPSRKCEDVDQQALTYSEIKALCTGDERIKEKLMLENDVKELGVLAAEHRNTVFEMEDRVARFPEHEQRLTAILIDLHTDREALRKLPTDPERKLPVFKITIGETEYTDRKEAAKALEDAVLAIKYADTPVKVGSFQGFDLSVTANSNMMSGGMSACLKGAASHTTKLIESFAHNLNRLEAALYNIDGRIERTQADLAKLRLDHEEAKCMGEERAKSLFKTLYKNGVSPKNQTMTIKDIYVGGDTTKYAFELQDGYCIETVCIKRRTGNTVCVSTMVGCPVGCIFCASGKNGFIRNLSPAEIVQQIVLLKERVNRIVFMGMGEPLFNYDNLIKSIHILRDRNGLNFPTDGINVSTVGPVEQLKRLREEHLKIQFTLSLHATDQATRNMIMPHMKSNSIHSVVEAALSYSERHNRKITIAYLLAPGINDRASDVRQLGKWFRGKNVLINLLQYNETACKRIKRPNKQQLVAFKIRLEEPGLEVKLRESRGNRIKAACGQLVSDYNKGNDAPMSDSPEKMSPVIHKLSDNKADTTRGIRKEKRHPFAKHKAKRKRKKN